MKTKHSYSASLVELQAIDEADLSGIATASEVKTAFAAFRTTPQRTKPRKKVDE